MGEPPSPEEAIARIPRWRGATRIGCTPLPGGSSNSSWLVEADDERAVLRLDRGRVPRPIVVPERELRILAEAAREGLAPEPLYADPDRGILVTRYVEGALLSAEDFRDAQVIAEIGSLLRRVHALPLCGDTCGLAEAGACYLREIRKAELLPRASQLLDRLRRVEAATNGRRCLNHRDPVAGNLIRCEDGLMLIDWEFAADGDPIFDLAAVVAHHDMARDQARLLLQAYGDASGTLDESRLEDMVGAYDALHWLWLAAGDDSPAARAQRRSLEARLAL